MAVPAAALPAPAVRRLDRVGRKAGQAIADDAAGLVGHHDFVRSSLAIIVPSPAAGSPARPVGTRQPARDCNSAAPAALVGDPGVLAQRRTDPSAPGIAEQRQMSGTELSGEFEELWDIRINLCKRFGIQHVRKQRGGRLTAWENPFRALADKARLAHRNRPQAKQTQTYGCQPLNGITARDR